MARQCQYDLKAHLSHILTFLLHTYVQFKNTDAKNLKIIKFCIKFILFFFTRKNL